jgi:ABC-type amino acid transport substrate-binding protein
MKFIFCFCVALRLFCAEGEFVVGTASGYAPYVSLNEKGEYEGFDIDVAKAISEKLKKKLVLKDLGSMPSLLLALQKKKIDSVMWAMSITPKRSSEMNMVYYHGENETHMPFIFWKNIPDNIQKIDDIAQVPNRVICVEAGTFQDSVLQQYPKLKVRFLDKIADAIMDVKYGKAFSAVIDSALLKRVQAQYPEIKVLNVELPESQQTFGFGICINKSNTQLTEQIRTIVAELRSSGKIAELEKKWNLQP